MSQKWPFVLERWLWWNPHWQHLCGLEPKLYEIEEGERCTTHQAVANWRDTHARHRNLSFACMNIHTLLIRSTFWYGDFQNPHNRQTHRHLNQNRLETLMAGMLSYGKLHLRAMLGRASYHIKQMLSHSTPNLLSHSSLGLETALSSSSS